MAVKKLENITFEETLKELDSIINALENGELSLNSALKQFERGISLARQGQKTLTDAEQRIAILLAKNDNAPLEQFEDTCDE
ncbi:exodeoxyribonuclease VII small subunit [Candidatus Enterovibrio altilux]|uniref:Exodeoxyribonuclease 7 small subunit n=1 Tax=Candidatus Enterovibrio altilux TaxID=1927128 RepID=A0A291B6J5_9GAMM|nr:exodeoxyribonuclease VII small subunit [Candidatus Enterovibrio luxaltus]ATF08624.1 Exodeoxyribonuclease VII small subunit [Candidatus Enterovibrio luxaltus]